MDAGLGVEPKASRYERDELPLLYPAMKWRTPAVMLRALPVFSGPQSLDLPDVQNWHGQRVSRPHVAVLETAALLVGHVRKKWMQGPDLHTATSKLMRLASCYGSTLL